MSRFDQSKFNANATMSGPSLEPDTWYKCVVSDVEVRPTKSGTGELLQVRVQVIEGPKQGAGVRKFFNIRNQNQVAEQIAYQELSALCVAIGRDTMIQNEAELIGEPFFAFIQRQKDNADYFEIGNVASLTKFAQQIKPTLTQSAPIQNAQKEEVRSNSDVPTAAPQSGPSWG